ncbi:eukaryotic aspartyl protease [Colletotrichum graminicola]|uniref:Eukaryotic aspartyl protease n=1 Tax=Colletotrichum graminicola (strain M1.001 / M2 / FGSC 10212) TaxID=645133 RepID=E3QP86_COLGM|nr:eukaryotic aspartyl protease [Colletotrichum graminicola M1.001]EFQ32674.1 eukaryotic aspartyl protease [Colletotrichum graminicola M1.001]WDK18119.1 eukaryotic aspartyl protease [Colletotrichum graminicola]
MRLSRVLALLAVTHEGASQKVVSASFHRIQFPPDLVQMTRRDTLNLTAINNITGAGYYSTVQVGTPGQKAMLQIDTGSSDTWILDSQADLCSSGSLQRQYGTGCTETFNSSMSSTFKLVRANDFDVAYLDGKRIRGDYIQDVVSFGGKTIKDQQLGLAVQTTRAAGLLGLGLTEGTTSDRGYPTILDNMVKQGQIGRKAYSIWLNDLSSAEGMVLFGGVDTEKYIGKLTTLPLVNDYHTDKFTSYSVSMTGVAIEAPGQKAVEMAAAGGSFNASTVLDSGATVCLLPDRLAKDIWAKYGVLDRGYGVLDCAWRGPKGEGHAIEFEFAGGGGVRVRVPLEEMVLDTLGGGVVRGGPVPFDRACLFGIQSSATFGVEGDGFALLGDTFLRSAYVVYDEANLQVGIAEAKLNASRSYVIELRANETALPTTTGPARTADGGAAATSPPVMTTTTAGAGESAAPTASESANAAPRGGVATSWGPDGFSVTSFVSVFAVAGAVLLAV